jgi:hypothetical protein
MNTTECHNCGATLTIRRPSKSGASFCSGKPECAAAKARFFRQRWKDGLTVERDSVAVQTFVSRALHEPRNACPHCGLADAVGPYVHRDARNPAKPCRGTGGIGSNEIPILWFDVVHPELAERARQPEPAES